MHWPRRDTNVSRIGLIRSWVLTHPRIFIFIVVQLVIFLLTMASIAASGTVRQHYWTMQIDVFTSLNGGFSNWPVFWLNMTYLCDAMVLLPLLSFLLIVNPRIYAAFFAAIPLSVLLVHGAKALTEVPRPAAVLDNSSIFILGELLTGHNSFPSGHAATAFVAGTVLIISMSSFFRTCYRTIVVLLIFTAATVLAISRTAVGAHWPIDIVYGAVCGFLGGFSGTLLVQRDSVWWIWLRNPRYSLAIGLVVILWSFSVHPVLGIALNEFIVSIYLSSITGILVGIYLVIRRFLCTSFTYKKYSMTLVIKYPSIDVSWNK